jgi:hypothetical protein
LFKAIKKGPLFCHYSSLNQNQQAYFLPSERSRLLLKFAKAPPASPAGVESTVGVGPEVDGGVMEGAAVDVDAGVKGGVSGSGGVGEGVEAGVAVGVGVDEGIKAGMGNKVAGGVVVAPPVLSSGFLSLSGFLSSPIFGNRLIGGIESFGLLSSVFAPWSFLNRSKKDGGLMSKDFLPEAPSSLESNSGFGASAGFAGSEGLSAGLLAPKLNNDSGGFASEMLGIVDTTGASSTGGVAGLVEVELELVAATASGVPACGLSSANAFSISIHFFNKRSALSQAFKKAS